MSGPSFISGRMRVMDSNIFALPGNPYVLHLITIKMGLREFIGMLDTRTQKVFIEEVVLQSTDFQKDVWANLKFISDDALAYDLAKFVESKDLLSIKRIHEILFSTTIVNRNGG